MARPVTNVVFAGLGGQGVIKASDILAQAAFRHGYDVKKSEIHGMSQRGGSVTSDVRFGEAVLSPMVTDGETDYLVVLAPEEVEGNRRRLRAGGVLIAPDRIDPATLSNPKSLTVALLGILSTHLDIPESLWLRAIHEAFPEKLHRTNGAAFALGRRLGRPRPPPNVPRGQRRSPES